MKTGPNSNSAILKKPRAWFLEAACNKPGSKSGRIWLISLEIGFSSCVAGSPPPNNLALFSSIKLYVTHSLYPIPAAARREDCSLSCVALKTGFGTELLTLGSGLPCSFVRDTTRATSSTRSASP